MASSNLRTITAAIAALDIDDLIIYDIDEIPEQPDTGAGAVMYPEPVNFVSELLIDKKTYGTDSQRALDMFYTLTYTVCYKRIDAGRRLAEPYVEMVDLVTEIIEAIASADLSGDYVMTKDIGVSVFGNVPDPSGNAYYGCQLTIRIMEMIQG